MCEVIILLSQLYVVSPGELPILHLSACVEEKRKLKLMWFYFEMLTHTTDAGTSW